MNKATRKARAAAAQPGTIAANHRIDVRDEPIAEVITQAEAAAKCLDPAEYIPKPELAAMPVRIVAGRLDRVEVWKDTSGAWWRYGASVRIQKSAGTAEREYRVILAKGANEDDLKFALATIAKARASETGAHWRRVTAPWADERTFCLAFANRQYVDPYTHGDYSPCVVVCDEPRCKESWHRSGAAHEIALISVELPDERGRYDVAVRRELNSRSWVVDVLTEEFYGAAEDVARFISDLQRMHAECARANADDTNAATN